MDCRDFLHLAEACRDGTLTRYARAVLEWHRRTCPRCAVLVRDTSRRPAGLPHKRAPLGARTA